MKKIKNILILALIIFAITIPVIATNGKMNRLKLSVVDANESYEIFILLPKKYIMYAINHDGLDIEYDGANTLKYNVIPSIVVDINNIVDDTYIDNEDEIEYVQIKLDDLSGEEYLFEIIPEYTDMDMRYRVKSASRDNIMIIEKFKIEDNMCNIEYNYAENTIRTERKNDIQIKYNISWWQIVVIAILIICVIFLYKKRS